MKGELVISHSDMDAAHGCGQAVFLDRSIPWLTRYQDSWWVVCDGGWLRITDELVAADIDDRLQRTAGTGDVDIEVAVHRSQSPTDSP